MSLCAFLFWSQGVEEGNLSESAGSQVVVAFQGIHGAYSEEAVRQHFGDSVDTLPCTTFDELFRAVESRQATFGMQPVENTLAGTVASAYELMMDYDFRIQAEVIVRVRHSLLAVPGTRLSDIKVARSHPHALAQCERYLARRGIKPVVHFDTAGSARDLAAQPEPDTAAIASPLAGKLYGLEALEVGIEDEPNNYTRFFVIGRGDPLPGPRNKTSVVFATLDEPGALHSCIGEFASRGINLTKIESKPRRNKPWQYYFYLDFEGHLSEPQCEAALMGLLRRAVMVKLLGSYPAAGIVPGVERNGSQ